MNKKQWYEKELGRYRKKVADQQTEIRKLKGQLETAMAGMEELQQCMDGILIQLGKGYGEKVEDAGYRLYIPLTPIADELREYGVHTAEDAVLNHRIIGIVRRK